MKVNKKYKEGGKLPKKIKKLQAKAAKKKAEDAKPSYRGKLDEVTVTAKAPTEAEKAGAKAFVEHDAFQTWAYLDHAAGKKGSKGRDGNLKSAEKLQKDTAKRLGVPTGPIKVGQTIKSKKRKKAWNKALKRYRK